MPKIAGKIVCPGCAGANVKDLGGVHYVKTGEGFGHEKVQTGHQCKDCGRVWNE
jgi:hypothetical protein